jgi:formyltetrahydrofolate-dependent phosphoribosylglycinamide formyltransferase
MRVRVGVLISGRGSNLAALLRATQAPDYPAEIALVMSNRADAAGLALAQLCGVPTRVIRPRDFGGDRTAHEGAMDSALRERGIKVVCLAGYMRILTPFLVQRWDGRMLNIHPSLLPAFPGLDTHRRALAAKVTRHGCTVHLVTEGMDEGPILGQASLLIQPGETEESLAARVLQLEHALYPWVLRHFIEGL